MNEREPSRREHRRSVARLILGVILLGVGAVLLAESLGIVLPLRLVEAWPLLIVAVGLSRLLWPSDRDDRRGGFWILTGGVYCMLSAWRLFGLHWGTAWPIFLIAQGLLIVFDPSGRGRGRKRRFSADADGEGEADDAR